MAWGRMNENDWDGNLIWESAGEKNVQIIRDLKQGWEWYGMELVQMFNLVTLALL